MNMHEYAVAQRYAIAFTRVFGDQSDHLSSLESAAVFLAADRRFYVSLQLPAYALPSKQEIIESFTKSFALPDSYQKLIMLMLKQGNILLCRTVFEKIATIIRRQKSIEKCTISTSHAVTNQQQDEISHFARQLLQKKLKTTFTVDSSLLCGLKIATSTTLWEKSVAKQLKHLGKVITNIEE